MDADLDRLIRLQQADSFLENARRRIADHPLLVEELDSRLADSAQNLESAKARVAENKAARAAVEKDLAMIQSRLSKFKGQLMEVKTNKEYTAFLKEIEVAQHEVRQLEDKILERMLEADDLGAKQKDAEARLAADKVAIAGERAKLEQETTQLQLELTDAEARREQIVSGLSPAAFAIYETVRAKRGLAVVEVKGGYCTACHVRMRPQKANELRRNDIIFQCESCQRVLYVVSEAGGTSENGPGA
jgi:predicted  nucleic acid-binding Zn-ribbon protein